MSGNTVPIERELLRPLRTIDPAPVEDAPAERHLRPAQPAPARSARRRSPLLGALAAVGIVIAIFATQLGLSIAVSEGAYEASALELEQRDLVRVERVLNQNVDKLASPQNLADNAAALGMVQNSNPATLRLSDNAVMGDLTQRTTEVQPNLVPNATLENLPVVDAEGLLVSRDLGQAAADVEAISEAPVVWEGNLPAPDTH